MFQNDLLIVLTTRLGSERLPRKAMLNIAGKPLIEWIVQRLQALGEVVLETTDSLDDADLWQLAHHLDIPIIKDHGGDIVSGMSNAFRYKPDAEFILRGLGDAPFFATELQARMVDALAITKKDIFYWFLPPYTWPLYGSRESPYSRAGWEKVNCLSTERNTPDHLFHARRELFDICYHVPPPNYYFRPNYRLEVDWQEDFDVVKAIGENGPGMMASIKEIVEYLDTCHDVAMLNHNRTERTGPSTYDHKTQRAWVKSMAGAEVMDWDNAIWKSPSQKAQPIFCKSGAHFLGWGDDAILHMKDGSRIASGYIACDCQGAGGLAWRGKH